MRPAVVALLTCVGSRGTRVTLARRIVGLATTLATRTVSQSVRSCPFVSAQPRSPRDWICREGFGKRAGRASYRLRKRPRRQHRRERHDAHLPRLRLGTTRNPAPRPRPVPGTTRPNAIPSRVPGGRRTHPSGGRVAALGASPSPDAGTGFVRPPPRPVFSSEHPLRQLRHGPRASTLGHSQPRRTEATPACKTGKRSEGSPFNSSTGSRSSAWSAAICSTMPGASGTRS